VADEIPDDSPDETTEQIELIEDDDGLAVIGAPGAVERFLDSIGLLAVSTDLRLGRVLEIGSDVAQAASDVAENSGRYVKLTRESAERVREFGWMKTKTPGISHAMIGDPGSIEKWIQIESGSGSLLTNPALLSGVGGLMMQLAKQAEADELKALLVRMDEKLDDARRNERDKVLAKMDRSSLAIKEAMTIRDHGGNTETAWGKVEAESGTLFEVQALALRALRALADKVDGKKKVGELAKAARVIEREVSIWLAVLARCFQLQDEFAVLEIDHVLETAPGDVGGHRRALFEAQRERRKDTVMTTGDLLDRMRRAGAIADSNVLLHLPAARAVVDSFNASAEIMDEFHAPLGIEAERGPMVPTPWMDALRDPQQLKNAGIEAGTNTLKTAVAVGGFVLAYVVKGKFTNRDA
jgi:hypothetical protein